MDFSLILTLIVGIISVFFGLLVIVRPKILATLVGIYFIIIGVLWILRALF